MTDEPEAELCGRDECPHCRGHDEPVPEAEEADDCPYLDEEFADMGLLDRTADGEMGEASQTFSGEVFTEYGVMDTSHTFPSEERAWHTETGQDELHTVVHVRVVKRGIATKSEAKRVAQRLYANDLDMDVSEIKDGRSGPYKAVCLSDTRGL